MKSKDSVTNDILTVIKQSKNHIASEIILKQKLTDFYSINEVDNGIEMLKKMDLIFEDEVQNLCIPEDQEQKARLNLDVYFKDI